MNLKNYNMAKKYAWKLGHTDLAHDAFLVWWDKRHTNLFDEAEKTIRIVIRNVFYTQRRKTQFQRTGERGFNPEARQVRQFVSIDTFEPSILPNQESDLELAETQRKAAMLTGVAATVYSWSSKGFSSWDIAEITGLTPQTVSNHRKKFRENL